MKKKCASVWISLRRGLFVLALAAPLGAGAQTVSHKVVDFLGTERVNELEQDKQGRETLAYLNFVADSSYRIVSDAQLGGKEFPLFSEIIPRTSKATGKAGGTTWVSSEWFNPLLYNFEGTSSPVYRLGNGNSLVILSDREINEKLYRKTSTGK